MAKVWEIKYVGGKHHGWMFRCPGCDQYHEVDDRWTFNGDLEKPTFGPSVRCTNPAYGQCHFYVIDGMVRFEPDDSHKPGQVVPLVDEPEETQINAE